MRHQLIIQSAAQEDIHAAYRWYEERLTGLGKEYIRSVDAIFSKIVKNPTFFPLAYRDARRALTKRFPFSVFFVVSEERIVILAVLHARRDPNMFHKRTGR